MSTLLTILLLAGLPQGAGQAALSSGPETVAGQKCGDGYKWDPVTKQCVVDPFSGGY